MIKIVGDGVIPEARAFDQVAQALNFDQDVYLGAMWAGLVGEHIETGAVVYNMEPLHDGCRSFTLGYLETLKRCRVLDYSRMNVEYLKTLGIEAFHMPYGFHGGLVKPVDAIKDIDFLLVGSINSRRERLLGGLHEHGVFKWVQGVYGDALDQLIASAKVHVNCHFSDSHQLEVVRLNYLMANGCNIVSESGNEDDVNQAYEGGLTFTGNLVDGCLKALSSPVDGSSHIKQITHSCEAAKAWLSSKSIN